MRRIFAQLRLRIRRWKQRDPDWETPSVTTLEFVAAGIAIDRLGGYDHLAERAESNNADEWLISGFTASDWRFIERLVREMPGEPSTRACQPTA
jgi:hypothetical protein